MTQQGLALPPCLLTYMYITRIRDTMVHYIMLVITLDMNYVFIMFK